MEELIGAAALPPTSEDAALSLTLAVVAAANSPLLLLDGNLDIIGMSDAFCRAFDVGKAAGQPVFALGGGEWDAPEIRAFLESAVNGQAPPDMEVALRGGGREVRRLIIHVERLVYLALDEVRLLMAVTDLTDARAADQRAEDLRTRNAILVQDARHRVANSLQIIASVLMQHARKTQSEETRNQLHNAHQRVMSVAALERHLAGAGDDCVQVRPYLVKLCEAIGASMIPERARVSLEVTGDDNTVDANVSVSLGLITTELVINAVKYAFPGGRSGRITVDYRAAGAGWVLTVRDNGVGLPSGTELVPGLGSSIVQALAMQLRALVVLDHSAGGASVSIVHPAPAGGS